MPDLDELLATLDARVNRALGAAAARLVELARAGAPKVSRELAKNIRKRRVSYRWHEAEASSHYATFVENGRGPVHARPGGVLRFVINGQVLFRRSVGPAKAQPFMRPARDAVEREIPDIFAEALA